MILLRSFLSGHIRIKRTLEYYDAGIGPRVPFGGGFGPTVSAIFATALGDYTTLSSVSSMPPGGAVSRAGNAMLYVVDGGVAKLTYAPNNVVLQSQALATSPWAASNGGVGSLAVLTNNFAVAPDTTTTATRVQCALNGGTTATDRSFVSQNLSLVTGTTYVVSFYAKLNTGTSAVMYALIGGASQLLPTVTSSWQRFSFVATATAAGSIRLGLYGGQTPAAADSIDLLLWGVQIEAVTYQTTPSAYTSINTTTTSAYYGPRFDYDPETLAAKGLLVEGQLQQLVDYSEDFTNAAWSKATCTVSTTSVTSPSNVPVTKNTLSETGTSSAVYDFRTDKTIISGTVYTFSTYVKASGRSFVRLIVNDQGSGTNWFAASFSLSGAGSYGTGTGTTGTVIGAAINSIGGGWYRVSVTGSLATTAAYCFIGSANGTAVSSSDTRGRQTLTGINGDAFNCWGAQLEARAFPTSYLPTQGGTSPYATRAAETLTLTGYTNRLVEAFYIDEQTNAASSYNVNASSTSPLTIINTGTTTTYGWGWLTSLRAYAGAYAGDIATPSWLSFSRAGGAMYYDSTGALTWAPSNMLLNSATLSTQTVTVTSGATNILSFSGTGSITYSGAASGTLAGTGANDRVSVVLTMSTASLTLTVSGTVSNAQLERVTYQTSPRAYIPTTSAAVYQPRYDYDPSTTPATPRGLLIEESRANLLTYSEQFDNAAWPINNILAFGSGSVANATTAPDGTTSADKIVENTSNAQHYIRRINSPTLSALTSYSYSVYVKAAGRQYVQLQLFVSNSFAAARFDVQNGTVVSTVAGSASILNTGNGWYRCTVIGTTASSVANPSYIDIQLMSDATTVTYTGDGVSGLFLWGAQLEVGSFATSYIPTTTGAVTRAADVAQLTGSALTTLQGSNWTFMGEVGRIPSASVTAGVIGTNSFGVNAIRFNGSATDLLTWQNNGSTYNFVTPVSALTNNTRIGLSGNASGTSSVASNGTVVTGGTISWAVGVYLGYGASAGGAPLNSTYRSLAIYNQKLPDTILKQKSAINAPY